MNIEFLCYMKTSYDKKGICNIDINMYYNKLINKHENDKVGNYYQAIHNFNIKYHFMKTKKWMENNEH